MGRTERYPDFSPEYLQVNNALRQTRRVRPVFRSLEDHRNLPAPLEYLTDRLAVIVDDIGETHFDDVETRAQLFSEAKKTVLQILAELSFSKIESIQLFYDLSTLLDQHFEACFVDICCIVSNNEADDQKLIKLIELLKNINNTQH